MGMNKNLLVPVLSILLIIGCTSPADSTAWYKGNLHTHTYWSDGDDYPEMVLDWYKSHGYDFVAISDHNIFAEGEKWRKIPAREKHLNGFREYLAKYGPDWVQYRQDSTGLQVKLKTLAEFRPLFEEPGKFLVINSEEITTSFNKIPVHLNAINLQNLIIPKGGNSVAEVMQNNVAAILAQRDSLGIPMLAFINHPNYKYALTVNDFLNLTGERFFELYNGHSKVNNYGDSLHISTEAMWDAINLAYAKSGKPLLYGLATDDSHHYHEFGYGNVNPGRGWVMVQAKELTPASLIAALEAGQFYASNGVTLSTVKFRNNLLEVRVAAEPDVTYEIRLIGVKNGDSTAAVIKTVTGTSASFTIAPDLLFGRVKVVSSKLKENPHQLGEYEVAWTQPVVSQDK